MRSSHYKQNVTMSLWPFTSRTVSQLVWGYLLALIRFDFIPAKMRPALIFALRTWLTSMLALYIAYAVQLDAPYWACLTVWLVANPTPGMVLSKSLYRALGTIAGAILGIVLIALFAQTPELFVLDLALLVAGCTVASSLLTNFRAYGAALTSYTAGIVAAGAIYTPDQVFFIALSRASAILIGIACAVLVTSIFAPHRSEEKARQQLLAILKDASCRAAYSWKGDPEERHQVGKKLINDIIALNTLIEFAAAESGTFRLQANNARSLLAHIFGLISARRSLDAHLNRCGWPKHDALEIFHEVFVDFLNEMPEKLDHSQIDELMADIHEVRQQVELLQPEQDVNISLEDLVSERLVIDRLDDLLSHLEGALGNWRAIVRGNWGNEPTLALNFHRDHRAAWINGLRAFLAVGGTGAFWIASAWTDGPDALIFVSILTSVIASRPHPDQVGWTFFFGYLIAIPFLLVCKFLVLPMGEGFEFISLALGLFLIPVGLALANPSTAVYASAFCLMFIRVVQPSNPMTYDLAETLNFALSIQVGALFGALAFVLVFPPDPQAARRYVTYRIRRGLELLARLKPIPSFSSWETRMYDRVNRLRNPENLSGTHTDEWIEAGLGALTLGNEILRLRHWLATEKLSSQFKEPLQKTILAFGRFRHEPLRAAEAVKDQIEQTIHRHPGPGQLERRVWARILGGLAEIDVYLTRLPQLLKLQEIT